MVYHRVSQTVCDPRWSRILVSILLCLPLETEAGGDQKHSTNHYTTLQYLAHLAKATHTVLHEIVQLYYMSTSTCIMFPHRQAIRQNLEEKVTPMLAAVITLADVNSGLDILSDSNASSSWLRTMYLRMLNDPRVVALTYVDLQSTEKRKVELDEMQVRSTGCDGAVFKARMPFSWIIKNTVDELIQQAQRMPGILNTP